MGVEESKDKTVLKKEIKGGAPWTWGDESKPPMISDEIAGEDKTFSTVGELLEYEEELEKKRLEKFIKE